ncbi:MAG: AsmA-like C-terminal domain-containing protein [Chloroflexota bacterium]
MRRALLEEPHIRIRLPARSEEPLDIEELEKQIQSALVGLTQELPAPRIDVSDGTAEIRIGPSAALSLENVAVRVVLSSTELGVNLVARSNLWEGLKIDARVSPEPFASTLEVAVRRLKVKESLALLPLRGFEYAQNGEASFEVKLAAVGLRKLKASIAGSTEPIVFARNGNMATLEVKALKGGIRYEGGALRVNIEQLDLGSPRLRGSGQLKIDAGSIAAGIKARGIDIAEVGGMAMRLFDEAEGVKRILRYAPAGTISEISIQAGGRSFADLALGKNVVLSGLLRDFRIFIPDPELELTNVSASVQLSHGFLEAKDIVANLGTAQGWNGKLGLGFEGKRPPFHLDILVRSGAPELQAVLLKVVHNEAARRELQKLQNVAGELSGRLILGETVDAISPVVAISKANVSANYGSVPFPIAIRSGQLNFDAKSISLKNAKVIAGRSSFAGFGVTFHHDGSRQIAIESKRALLDLQQAATCFRSFESLRPQFEKLQSVRGQIDLRDLALTGPYDDPGQWVFSSTGTLNQVEIRHRDAPERLELSRGKFNVIPGKIQFSDAAVSVSDTIFTGSGTFAYKNRQATRFEMSGMGTIGEQMTQWLSRYLELPKDVKLRSPLKMTATHLGWGAAGDISFRGQVIAASGVQLSLDAVKQPRMLTLRNVEIHDGNRRARMTLQIAKENLDGSFSGELTDQTIDKIFAGFPMKGSSLNGNIQMSAALAEPVTLSADGQLSGRNLLIPLATEDALIENFSIEASGESVKVLSADLQWSEGHLWVSGRISSAQNQLRVDADITGDRVDWENLQRNFGGKSKDGIQERSGFATMPDVAGTIRLKTDRFVFDRFNFSPLEATASFSESGIGVDIDRGVACGITASGRVDMVGADIGIDLRLSATDAPLEPTAVCLTNQQNDVKGIYSLTARLAGRGNRGQLLRSLKGNFEFSARDGEFIRSPGIDATFDYLNSTGDFKVAFPDLDRETFPYRFIGVKGRIDGKMLVGDEINVASSQLNLSGQGKVDLELKQVDGKGLIAVLKPIDDVIARIPVISSMLGGSLVGIPVRVTGPLERPDVTYLSPSDVGVELLNVPLRILGLPLGAMRLFTPTPETRDNELTQ